MDSIGISDEIMLLDKGGKVREKIAGEETSPSLERLAQIMDHDPKRLEHHNVLIGGHVAYAPQVVFDYLYRLSGMEEEEAARMTMRSVALGERRWKDLGMDMTYAQTYGNWLAQFGIADIERPVEFYEAASKQGTGVYLLPSKYLSVDNLLSPEAHVDLAQLRLRVEDVEHVSKEERGHALSGDELIRLMDQSYQMRATGNASLCRGLLPPLWEETMRLLDREAVDRMTALGDKLFDKRTATYEGFEGQEYHESFYVTDDQKAQFAAGNYYNLSSEDWHMVVSQTTE